LPLHAGAALGQSCTDLVAVLNSTDGASTMAQVVSEVPGFLDIIADKTNLTFLAPNDTAVAQLLNNTEGQAIEDAGDDYLLNLLLYHVIYGGYNNITDYYVDHTLLISSNYTNVTGGQNVGIFYDDKCQHGWILRCG